MLYVEPDVEVHCSWLVELAQDVSPSDITLGRFINGYFLDLSGSAVAALMHSSTGPQKPVLSVPPIPPIPSISPIPSIEPVQPVWPIPPLRGSSTKWEDFIGA